MEQGKVIQGSPHRLQDFFFQVVVKFQDDHTLFDSGEDIDFDLLNEIIPWSQFRNSLPEIKINRLFTSLSVDELKRLVETATSLDRRYQAPNFLSYYLIGCPTEFDARAVGQSLVANRNVDWAYIVNDSTPPNDSANESYVVDMRQEYLGFAPHGVNVEYASAFKGGDGEGQVKFIDIEQGWILDHESIRV